MRKILTVVIAMLAAGAFSQTEQSGIPARLTAANGNEVNVFLQQRDGDNLIFQIYRSTSTQTVPSRLISKIDFLARFDAETAAQRFADGDYQGLIDQMSAQLIPSPDEYWPFMTFENNLQESFVLLMQAYLKLGDVSKALEVSSILMQNQSPAVNGPAQSIAILAALEAGQVDEADALLGQVTSGPAALYLGACVARAKGNYQAASLLVADLIAQYGNDLSWMPQSELLSAYLYADQGLTNSAISTARQVDHIYVNTSYSTEAKAKQTEWAEAQAKAEAKAKAEADAEAARRAEVRARNEARAQGEGFGALVEEPDEGTNSVDQAGTEMDAGDGDEDSSVAETNAVDNTAVDE